MDQLFAQFSNTPIQEAGNHKIPLEFTAPAEIRSPQMLYFPFPKGVLSIQGKDRESFLQGYITGDIRPWKRDQGYRTIFPTPKGKIQFDLFILKLEEEILIITDPGEESRLQQYLDFYMVREEVSVQDCSQKYQVLYLFQENGGENSLDFQAWPLATGADSRLKVLLVDQNQKIFSELEQAGFQPIGLNFFDQLRPFYQYARMGMDFSSDDFPKEAGLNQWISYTKGCFLGQEPIARMHNRGRPGKELKLLKTKQPCENGTVISSGEKEVGKITTASSLLFEDYYLSFAYLKSKWLLSEEKAPLLVGEQEAELTE